MKTWNDPTVITDILPQTNPRKTIIKVELLTEVLEFFFPATHMYLKNMKNKFGYEISASGQRYHIAGTIEHSNWLG